MNWGATQDKGCGGGGEIQKPRAFDFAQGRLSRKERDKDGAPRRAEFGLS